MKVTLTRVTERPVEAIEEAASNCYDSEPSANGKIMRHCHKSGHHSVLEFADFTFHIEGVSRALLTQITRHRIADFAVRSQRYCSSFGDGIPPLPKGDKKSSGKQNLYDNQETLLVSLYNRGYSAAKIGEMYNVPTTTVNGIIKRHQSPRNLSETKFIDKKYFVEINSKIKAYILGFLYADGCLSIKTNGTKQVIVDQLEDEELFLRNILHEIKPNGNIIKSGHDNMIRIAIQDNDICSDLERYGIISHKGTLADFSHIFELVDDAYIKDVIRGVFEGDGHIHVCYNDDGIINDARFEIAGTLSTCKQIQYYLVNKLGLKEVNIQHNGNQSYKFGYSGRVQVTKIIEWLYEDIDVNFLHSKKARVVFELIPQFKEYYKKQISEMILNKYESVIPPSYFANIDAVNAFVNHLESAKSTYILLQEKLASCGLYGEDANQDARFVLPNACTTVIEVKMNGRALINFFAERLCSRAQWEIRKLAQMMLNAIKEHDDQCAEYAKLCGPKCERYGKDVGFCPEVKSCGRHPRLKDVMEGYYHYQDLCNS